MNDIGVVNWYNKKFETPPYTMEEIWNGIKDEIIQLSIKTKNTTEFIDDVEEVLKKYLIKVPADGRLPVSSLYHHMKNTAGIAYCIGLEKGIEKGELEVLRLSALLHDIGKIKALETGKIAEHVKYTRDFCHGLEGSLRDGMDEDFLTAVSRTAPRHHSKKFYLDMGFRPTTEIEKIICEADNIASGADRAFEVVFKDGKLENKDSVFPHIFPELKSLNSNEGVMGRGDVAKVDAVKVGRIRDEVVGGTLDISEYIRGGTRFDVDIGILRMDIHGIQRYIGEVKKIRALNAGSAIVEDVQHKAAQIVAEHVCKEAVIYSGGGNLIAFVPANPETNRIIKEDIQNMVNRFSKGGLKASVITSTFPLRKICDEFDKCVTDTIKKIYGEKNKSYSRAIMHPERSTAMCDFCFRRKGKQKTVGGETVIICEVCHNKMEYRPHTQHGGKQEPSMMEDIGGNIAVIAMDGNMIGTMFQQSMTPADYSFKSQLLDDAIRDVLEERDELMEKHKGLFGETGFKMIYCGGDDIFCITNARGALHFADYMIEKVAEKLKFESDAFSTPIVTLSVGIAMARHDFPIYFLMEKAHSLEKKAKEAFRERLAVNERTRLFIRPKGAIALSVVSSSMPGEDDHVFVIGAPQNAVNNDAVMTEKSLQKIKFAVERSNKDGWKSLLSLVINTQETLEERINLTKYLYAQLNSKSVFGKATKSSGMSEMEVLDFITDVVKDERTKRCLGDVIPMVWRAVREEGGD